MAHHKSAKKRIRQTERRTAVNRMRVSRIRTFLKKVENAIAAGDQAAAQAAFKDAEPAMASGVSQGVVHKNTLARKISRLSNAIKKLGAQPQA